MPFAMPPPSVEVLPLIVQFRTVVVTSVEMPSELFEMPPPLELE